MALLHEDLVAILGAIDETLAADIVATGATIDELAQAWAWMNSDDALMDEGRRLPSARVQGLVDLLTPEDDLAER